MPTGWAVATRLRSSVSRTVRAAGGSLQRLPKQAGQTLIRELLMKALGEDLHHIQQQNHLQTTSFRNFGEMVTLSVRFLVSVPRNADVFSRCACCAVRGAAHHLVQSELATDAIVWALSTSTCSIDSSIDCQHARLFDCSSVTTPCYSFIWLVFSVLSVRKCRNHPFMLGGGVWGVRCYCTRHVFVIACDSDSPRLGTPLPGGSASCWTRPCARQR